MLTFSFYLILPVLFLFNILQHADLQLEGSYMQNLWNIDLLISNLRDIVNNTINNNF